MDLLAASRLIEKPLLSCIWDFDDQDIISCPPVFKSDIEPGCGFWAAVRDTLPSPTASVLAKMSLVDSVMAFRRLQHMENTSFDNLMRARFTIHHSILALPRWDELSENAKLSYEYSMYETVRLAATLYSTAIIWAMPPHTGWHLLVLQQLHKHVHHLDLWQLSRTQLDLLIWSVMLASIIAYLTEWRDFYLHRLLDALVARDCHDLSTVLEIVTRMAWSMSACMQGAEVVWVAIEPRVLAKTSST